ncbi:MAG: holo-ACP synthase [Treponema sp.]|jgi:holo-[acyl-carrier protein] synthase|nr:holo-ACP synthase [Treponema sp.]
MTYGIGCDIVKVSRFEKWVSGNLIDRFFNQNEKISDSASTLRKCEYYAGHFAVKEAFSKALGTGISGFDLRDVYIIKDELGKPELIVKDRAQELLEKKCGTNSRLHVTLSHEKEYAVAFVQIEN